MTDEIFRDDFCDDIFRSMKAQMEPSNDVVADLLSKIAAETASTAIQDDKVLPFRKPETNTDFVKKRGRFSSKKSIWYYGTALAASAILMVSTLTLADDPGNMEDIYTDVVGPDVSVNIDDESGNELSSPIEPVKPVVPDADAEKEPSVSEEPDTDEAAVSDNITSENKTDSAVSKPADKPVSKPAVNPDTDKSESKSPAKGNKDSEKKSETAVKDSDNKAELPEAQPDEAEPFEDSRITPGSDNSAVLSWTDDFLCTEDISRLSFAGNTYIIEGASSAESVGTAILFDSVNLPETETTTSATLSSVVYNVADVSTNAMVAMEVSGFEEPLIYSNPQYSPETLGDIITDYNLEGNISFLRSIQYRNSSSLTYFSHHSYSKEINEAVWEHVFSDTSAAKASINSYDAGKIKVTFSSSRSKNPTGSQMQFGVSDNGYLYVSILDKKQVFNIGDENAKSFIEYVIGEPLE